MNSISRHRQKVVIAGAGPAGSSLAIRLAGAGFEVTIIERAEFPRHKLCGEFVSPECLAMFGELGLRDEIDMIGVNRIAETVFYDAVGRSFSVPSTWLGGHAVGISRAAMDAKLLDHAVRSGVTCKQRTSVMQLIFDGAHLAGLKVRGPDGSEDDIVGDVFVDATGRGAVLARMYQRNFSQGRNAAAAKPDFVGFKAHIKGSLIAPGRCEIYSFPHGYGGLTRVENGSANFCFLLRASAARAAGGNAASAVETWVLQNARARETMSAIEAESEWLAVALQNFGLSQPAIAENMFTVGDAAAFIDPFTGSGILMSLEGSRILAGCLIEGETNLKQRYLEKYRRHFRRRLFISSIFRRAAYSTRAASFAVAALGLNNAVSRSLMRATRPAETNSAKVQ